MAYGPYSTQTDLENLISAQQLAQLTSDNPRQIAFTVSGVVTAPAAGDTYSNNAQTVTIVSCALVNGNGTIVGSSTGAILAAGLLTKVTGNGDAAISYSAETASDTNVVAALISRADRLIDSKAGQVYTVPFDPTPVTGNCTAIPSLVSQISVTYACYFAMLRRFGVSGISKDWQALKADADQQLDDLSNELVALDGDPTVASPESNMVTPTTDSMTDFYDPNNPLNGFVDDTIGNI